MSKYYINRFNHVGKPVPGQLLLPKKPKYGKSMELFTESCSNREMSVLCGITKPDEETYPVGITPDPEKVVSGNHIYITVQFTEDVPGGGSYFNMEQIFNLEGDVEYTLDSAVATLNHVVGPFFTFKVEGEQIYIASTSASAAKEIAQAFLVFVWDAIP